jgi:hypothetical protein
MGEPSRHPIGRFAMECLERGSEEPFVLSPERSVTLALALTGALDGDAPKAALLELAETAHFVAVTLEAPSAGARILETIRMVLSSRRSDVAQASIEHREALRRKRERLERFVGRPSTRTAPMIDRDRPTRTVASFQRKRITPR